MTKDRTLSTAIQILTILAFREGQSSTSEEMAVSLQTNPGLVRRVLAKLAKAGLVETRAGKNGGAEIARPASKISLREVYEAVDAGPLFGTFDKEPYQACVVSCQMGGILDETYSKLQSGLKMEMGKIKLEDIVKKLS